MIVVILVIIIILLCIWTWYHPEFFLTPLNLLYNLDSSYRTNFYTDIEQDRIFPAGVELESIWQDIRQEGDKLYQSLPDKNINYLDNYYINIGNESKKNWTTIPLRLFGHDSPYYMEQCPILSNFLREHPEIKSCLFSIMDPGKIIEPHIGPYDGLLRYQLALDIPKHIETSFNTKPIDEFSDSPDDITFPIKVGKNECYLYVGGEVHEWIEGKGVLFDEANLHGAVNTTSEKRMVLLIDIERPYSLFLYRWINKIIIWGMGLLPATKQATLS